jgi:membrane protein insertase Oxa1/YidC/SpoIIIJ
MIELLHDQAGLPYWACFSAMALMVRTALFPVVVYGAHTASRVARIVPEIQFLVQLFRKELAQLKARKASTAEQAALWRINLKTLGGIYKHYKVNPLAVFASPLLQIPIFLYVSMDLRKIVHGLDPKLAQALVEAPIAWIPDLTEHDPWFGLAVLTGMTMYWNVEVAVGRKSLTGTGQSDTAVILKDVFQSVAVFMPCFTAHLPAGVQIYVVTSFVFTIFQSAALRTDSIRVLLGLPALTAPPPEAELANKFIKIKQLERDAQRIRGSGPVLGQHGVLAVGLQVSFPGSNRSSTIKGSGHAPIAVPAPNLQVKDEEDKMAEGLPAQLVGMPLVHGVTAPMWQIQQQLEAVKAATDDKSATVLVDKTVASSSAPPLPFIDEQLIKSYAGQKVASFGVKRVKRNMQKGKKKR